MAELTVQAITKAGLAGVSAALASADVAGDTVKQAQELLIVMDNTDSSPHTLTVAAPAATAECGDLGSLAVSDLTLVVANGNIGFLTIPSGYGDGAEFSWTYDDVTSLAIGVFSLAP